MIVNDKALITSKEAVDKFPNTYHESHKVWSNKWTKFSLDIFFLLHNYCLFGEDNDCTSWSRIPSLFSWLYSQDIKTQPQFNHYLVIKKKFPYVGHSLSVNKIIMRRMKKKRIGGEYSRLLRTFTQMKELEIHKWKNWKSTNEAIETHK